MTILREILAMQQANQAQALNQLKLAQSQSLFPMEQQLKQLQMERERQAIDTGQLGQEAGQFRLERAQKREPLEQAKLQFEVEQLFNQLSGGGKINVKNTEIYKDGTMLSQTDRGPRVWGPDGVELKGEDASRAIEQANDYEVTLKNLKMVAEKTADQSIKLSSKAFEKAGEIRKGVINFNEAIRLIDEGAKTGKIMSRLPSIQTASVELDNLVKRLGLDVVGAGSFGALSEGELRFAVNSAAPTDLRPEAFRDWLVRKRDAQSKVLSELEDMASYLGRGGKVPEYIEMMKKAQKTEQGSGTKKEKEKEKDGGVLMEDAQGNRAIVYPDGSFKEVE
jgi:hypothetical protein